MKNDVLNVSLIKYGKSKEEIKENISLKIKFNELEFILDLCKRNEINADLNYDYKENKPKDDELPW